MQNKVSTALNVNHGELSRLIYLFWQKKKSLFIWGTTGIGKSQEVRATAERIAKELGLEYSESIKDINDETKFLVIDIRLSQLDPSDLRGIPVFDKEAKVTMWLPPESLPREGKGIMLFDEMNLAAPLIQASAYQLILDRQLGTYLVPEGFMLIGAGNRLEDRANVFDMAAPLKNRFGHCQLDIPSVEEWTNWAVKHQIDPRIVGFLNFKRTLIFTFDPHSKENAFATPRAWEATSRLIIDIPSSDLAWLNKVISTEVGVGVAGEFTTFLRIRSKLKPLSFYLNNPKTCPLPSEETELDLVWALITSLTEWYGDHKDVKTIKAIVEIIKRLHEEYAALTLKLMLSVDDLLAQKLCKIASVKPLFHKLRDFFE